jgi:hypothetical protein
MSNHSHRFAPFRTEDGSIVVDLFHPMHLGGKVVTFVWLRRARLGDIKATEATRSAEGSFAAVVRLIAEISGLSPDDVCRIDADDFLAIAGELEAVVPPALIPAWRAA